MEICNTEREEISSRENVCASNLGNLRRKKTCCRCVYQFVSVLPLTEASLTDPGGTCVQMCECMSLYIIHNFKPKENIPLLMDQS